MGHCFPLILLPCNLPAFLDRFSLFSVFKNLLMLRCRHNDTTIFIVKSQTRRIQDKLVKFLNYRLL